MGIDIFLNGTKVILSATELHNISVTPNTGELSSCYNKHYVLNFHALCRYAGQMGQMEMDLMSTWQIQQTTRTITGKYYLFIPQQSGEQLIYLVIIPLTL